MEFIVGPQVIIRNAESAVFDFCRERLELDNPEYKKKERMGLWTGSTPRRISLYEKNGANIIVPFGFIEELRAAFPDTPARSKIGARASFDYESSIKLYPYQESAVTASLTAKNGVLVMPCGAGKTQVGLELVSRIGVRSLWVTHTQELMKQSMDRARMVLGCKASSYGTITGGKVNIGEGLTFATVQTLSRLDLPKYKNVWGCILVDECHKAVGSPTKVMQFYRVLSNLSARYKFGLTATPKRADGLEMSMFALLGGIVYSVDREDVASTTCRVKVMEVDTSYYPDTGVILAGDGTLDYNALVSDLTGNANRFQEVLSVIEEVPRGEPMIILGNRVDYLERLNKAFSGRSACLSGRGNSKAEKEARNRILDNLRDGSLDAVFATYQLAKEGLDVPGLKYLVMATPEKDDTTVTQSGGRVGRKADGKEYGTIIDFCDQFGMYQAWAKKRKNIYKKLGYEIISDEQL